MTNGDTYEGQLVDNKFQGKGKITFAENDEQERKQYDGHFENNQFHGSGTMHYQNGDKLKATWLNDEI